MVKPLSRPWRRAPDKLRWRVALRGHMPDGHRPRLRRSSMMNSIGVAVPSAVMLIEVPFQPFFASAADRPSLVNG